MPGQTSPRNYPYPLGPERIDIAGDIKRLAEAIDDDVAALNALLSSGDANNAAAISALTTTVNGHTTAINNHTSQINAHTSQIGTLQSQVGTLQAQVSDLYARRPVMYHANNPSGIATAANAWAQYQCGTLVLATYNYNCMITVNIGMTTGGGGICRLIAGVGASMQVGQGEAQAMHLAGDTYMMSHTIHVQLGPGSHNISLWGLTTGAGNMGRAFVSAIATPY